MRRDHLLCEYVGALLLTFAHPRIFQAQFWQRQRRHLDAGQGGHPPPKGLRDGRMGRLWGEAVGAGGPAHSQPPKAASDGGGTPEDSRVPVVEPPLRRRHGAVVDRLTYYLRISPSLSVRLSVRLSRKLQDSLSSRHWNEWAGLEIRSVLHARPIESSTPKSGHSIEKGGREGSPRTLSRTKSLTHSLAFLTEQDNAH